MIDHESTGAQYFSNPGINHLRLGIHLCLKRYEAQLRILRVLRPPFRTFNSQPSTSIFMTSGLHALRFAVIIQGSDFYRNVSDRQAVRPIAEAAFSRITAANQI